jgi:formate hydrogenlyase transcriptional activator
MPFLWLPVFTKMTSETHGARRSSEPLDLRDLIETIPALVLCALADGSAEFANRAWQDYSGRPLQELTGSGWQTTIHPDDIANFFHESTVAPVSGKSIETEARLRRADGQYHWFSIRKTLAVSRSQNSEPSLRTLIACEDIEERKQEEFARRYSEERHRLVVETANDAVISLDESGAILLANPATTRVFGYDPAELIGKPLTILMPEFLRKLHEAGFKRYLATGQRHINWQGTELTGLRKNGKEFPVEVSFGELIKDGHRVFTGFLRDITERKRAEEKIRQSEKELRQLLDFTPQHVTVLGPDRRRLYNNHAALDYHGLTLEEWQTADPDRLFHPQDWERITREVYSKFLSGSSLDIEVRLRRRDGQYRWFLIRYNPTLDEQGRPTRWYAAATDIEDRKQAEQRLQNENVALREEIDRSSMFEEIVGRSPALQAVIARVSKVAPTDSAVLITGETGTGKELIARAIHKRSRRSARVFVSVNCGAISAGLVESELFGHVKGAFTGAIANRDGRFKVADGGTILLDEVGDLPPETQMKLLRVLQEHEFEPIGCNKTVKVDVRLIAATNRNLEEDVRAGKFRSDLLYRLNVFPIRVPPLRERREDVPLLVAFLLQKFSQKLGKSVTQVLEGTMRSLVEYSWPGNVRELQNILERAVILSTNNVLALDREFSLGVDDARAPAATEALRPITSGASSGAGASLRDAERRHIEAALAAANWVIEGEKGAARMLDVHPNTLRSRMKRLNIQRPCGVPADGAPAYGGTSSS